MPNTDLTPISPDDCKDVDPKGKSKPLQDAYRIASENHELQDFKDILVEHQEAVNEDIARKEEKEAKKAAKADKARRKSEVTAKDEDDMDIDEETEKPKSKKRKKAVESYDEDEKVTYPLPNFYNRTNSYPISLPKHQSPPN